jgi:DNA gyrase subunit A
MLNLKDLIKHYVDHRHEVVVRRTQYELDEALKRAHILEGLLIAIDNLDAVIKIIREAETPDEARSQLMENFKLSEIQAKAILDMRLRALTGLERDKIKEEYAALMKQIEYYRQVLADEGLRMSIIKQELAEMKEKYGDERRTEIIHAGNEMSMEDLIPDDEVVITISHLGYVKRTLLSEYRTQNRGGRGSRGVSKRDEDFVEHVLVATNHNYILFFTNQGKCYWLKVWEIPEGDKISKGRAIQNLINITADEKIMAYLNVKTLTDEAYIQNTFVVMCTEQGTIKKTTLEAYSRPRANGVNAINVREGDMLVEARLTNGACEMIIASLQGKAIRFNESTVRPMGRTATGVRAIRLDEGDKVIGMIAIEDPKVTNVLVVAENGLGKRSEVEDYRITNRGGKGVMAMNITDKTGKLVAIKEVDDTTDIMIMTKKGITIRMSMKDLRILGRVTQGVRLINIDNDDAIASVAKIDDVVEDEQILDGETDINTVDLTTDAANPTNIDNIVDRAMKDAEEQKDEDNKDE